MPPINAELLGRIRKKLAISERRAYELVAGRAGETHLPRHLAAVALAADLGINTNKSAYATDEERAQIRAAARAVTVAQPVRQLPAASAPMRSGTRRPGAKNPRSARKSNSVMVVHGRNTRLRGAMYSLLRALGLEPIEWSHAVNATKKGAPFVGEVLNAAFRQAAAVVVLLTPDDEARLKSEFLKPSDPNYERELTGQARPNVLFEAGRAFGSHPDSTILVQIGEVRPFSDAAGIHIVHLGNDPQSRTDLANRLETAGCAVNKSGTDWLSEGDFSSGQPANTRSRRASARKVAT